MSEHLTQRSIIGPHVLIRFQPPFFADVLNFRAEYPTPKTTLQISQLSFTSFLVPISSFTVSLCIISPVRFKRFTVLHDPLFLPKLKRCFKVYFPCPFSMFSFQYCFISIFKLSFLYLVYQKGSSIACLFLSRHSGQKNLSASLIRTFIVSFETVLHPAQKRP